jgi:hypothetical protein
MRYWGGSAACRVAIVVSLVSSLARAFSQSTRMPCPVHPQSTMALSAWDCATSRPGAACPCSTATTCAPAEVRNRSIAAFTPTHVGRSRAGLLFQPGQPVGKGAVHAGTPWHGRAALPRVTAPSLSWVVSQGRRPQRSGGAGRSPATPRAPGQQAGRWSWTGFPGVEAVLQVESVSAGISSRVAMKLSKSLSASASNCCTSSSGIPRFTSTSAPKLPISRTRRKNAAHQPGGNSGGV